MVTLGPGKRFIPIIVSLAMFMEALDTTIINTAIPAISRSLQINPIDLKIALICYLLSLAVFIPISGWIADKYGSKRVFLTALVIFTLSSLACGFARQLFFLVIARIFQGIGGALTIPVGKLIILRSFPRHQFTQVMNRVIVISSLGVMLGPVLGGFITHYYSWHWIFWINVPVGVLAILITDWKLSKDGPLPVPPLDTVGFILFGLSLASFTLGLSLMSETTQSYRLALCVMIGALFLLFLYSRWSRTQQHPIINVKLLNIPTFNIAFYGGLFARLGFGGMPFLVPLLLQVGLHYPAQVAGLLLLPIALGLIAIRPLVPRILQAFGYRRVLFINTILLSLNICSFVWVNAQTSVHLIMLFTFLYGLLTATQFSSMNSLSYADVPIEQISGANSLVSILQQMSQSFGVAVVAIFLHFFSRNTSPSFTLTPPLFHATFLMMGIITFLASAIFLRLKPLSGAAILKKNNKNGA